jgi:hypothetical protein
LQCCYNQASIDCLFVIYCGSVESNALFNPDLLLGCFIQVRNRSEADAQAEINCRPITLPRDLNHPLPYLMLLMELGTQSAHQKTRSQIKCAVSQPSSVPFRDLVSAFHTAWDTYLQCAGHIGMDEKRLAALKDDAKEKQRAVDRYNRYSISVRGVLANAYGILKEAGIAREFQMLHLVSSRISSGTTPQMRPWERLGEDFPQTGWMYDYEMSESGENG